MKILFLNKGVLLLGMLAFIGCENRNAATTATEPAKDEFIVVTQQGSITLNGSKVESFEQLAAELATYLAKQDSLPADIPVKYEGEVLMGTRSEIQSIIAEALQKERGARYKPAIDALRPTVEQELTIPVALRIELYTTEGSVVFLAGTVTSPNGSPLDFSKTPFATEWEGGSYSDSVFALLKHDGDNWKVITSSVGATDVPYICWWKEFNLPITLFPEGMAAPDCE
ncbi:MAG: hypothetical protein JNK77_18015 [Saprospiraceae bacterium]|nr:hypothetical protein [Saprospiraceae bacterium]